MMKVNSTSDFYKLTATPQRVLIATPNRAAIAVQNQGANPIWIAPSKFVSVKQALKIEAGLSILRDIYCPTGELWACTDAAGEAAGDGATIAEDFV